MGWTLEGEIPAHLKKYIIVGAPHTSGWDFIMCLLARTLLGLDIKYLGKAELFGPPFGFIFRWLGGYPVDRSKKNNIVEAVVDIFDGKEEFAIGLAPEGTRKYVEHWKTGFHAIAYLGKIPIIPIALNFGEKKIMFFPPFYATEDTGGDIKKIRALYKGIKGRHPEKHV